MSEPLSVRKEVIVKEDGRIVILYSFVHVADLDKSQPRQEPAAT